MGHTVLGGPVTAMWRLVQGCCQGQYVGRWMVGLFCGRVSRVGTPTRCRWRVASRALACDRLARTPVACSRLWHMATQMTYVAFAANSPEGRWASGPSMR